MRVTEDIRISGTKWRGGKGRRDIFGSLILVGIADSRGVRCFKRVKRSEEKIK